MSGTEEYERAVTDAVNVKIGTSSAWAAWPGGWPGDIEAALVDSVFSARAQYQTVGGKGIHHQVITWQAKRPGGLSTLGRLSRTIRDATPTGWAADFGNSQRSPGRRATAPGGPTKAAAVLEATGRLMDIGVHDHTAVTVDSAIAVRRELRKVSGIGYATANYFTMLLGVPGVKPDRMVHRFLRNVTGQNFSDADAEAIITAAATRLEVAPQALEHAIWKHESDSAART